MGQNNCCKETKIENDTYLQIGLKFRIQASQRTSNRCVNIDRDKRGVIENETPVGLPDTQQGSGEDLVDGEVG